MRRIGWGLAALVVAVGLAGCSGEVKLNGEKIDKEVPFLSTIEDGWSATMASDPYSTKAAETHCWLLRSKDGGALEQRALCGPIRHLSSDGDGIFDAVTFVATGTGDAVSVDPESVMPAEAGVTPPATAELYRPDGAEPSDADLPAPEAPKAGAGMVQKIDSADIDSPQQAAGKGLITPAGTVQITKLGKIEHLTGEGEAPYFDPAAGEEFVAFVMTWKWEQQTTSYWGADSGSVDTTPALSVVNGKKVTNLDTMMEGGDDDSTGTSSGQQNSGSLAFVVSTPTGEDPQLQVGVAGVDQTMSIRTGERTSKTAEAYYTGKTSVGVQKQFPQTDITKGDFEVSYGITFTEAERTPFDKDKGWASQGKSFIALDWTSQNWQYDGNMYDPNLDTKASLVAKVQGGGDATVVTGNPLDNTDTSEGTLVLEVPEDATKVDVTFQPHGTFAAGGIFGDVMSPKAGKFSFKKLDFTIDFT